MSRTDDQKREVGEAAANLVRTGMVVGLGTGSTAAWFVRSLAARGLNIRGVATSQSTAMLASSLGLSVISLDEVSRIDLTIDGADEIGPGLALIKGGGAALLREKLVWEASSRCVAIADAGKRVQRLGAFPLPIEVIPFGHLSTARRISDALSACGLQITPKLRLQDGAPVRTDQGNYIYDAPCGAIDEPTKLAGALKAVTGVVDHGLFLNLADEALIAGPSGVERLTL